MKLQKIFTLGFSLLAIACAPVEEAATVLSGAMHEVVVTIDQDAELRGQDGRPDYSDGEVSLNHKIAYQVSDQAVASCLVMLAPYAPGELKIDSPNPLLVDRENGKASYTAVTAPAVVGGMTRTQVRYDAEIIWDGPALDMVFKNIRYISHAQHAEMLRLRSADKDTLVAVSRYLRAVMQGVHICIGAQSHQKSDGSLIPLPI